MKHIIILLILLATNIFAQPFSDMEFFYGSDQEAPASPTSLLAVGAPADITLTWADATALDCYSVRVYRSDETGGTYTWIASVAKGTQTYLDSALTEADSFYYKIKAKDQTGNLSAFTSVAWDTVQNIQYASVYNGTTQYLSKASPVNLDLNGAERITNALNTGFEVGSEVITNGSFGSDITGWTGYLSTLKWYNTDWNAVSRTNALLDSATDINAFAIGTYSFTSGVRYKLTYTYYIPSTNTVTVKIKARLVGGSNPYLTTYSTTDAWTTVSEYFVADGDYTAIRFYQTNAAGSGVSAIGDKIYIDDVSIKPVPYYASNGTHSIDTSSTQKYAGSYSGKVIAALGSELVTNGTMEADANWANISGQEPATNERSSTQAHTDTYSRKMIVNTQYDGIASDAFTITAGITYTASLWIYGDATTPFMIRIIKYSPFATVAWLNPSGTAAGNTTAASWTNWTTTFTATETLINNAKVWVQSATGNSTGTCYFDDITIKQSSGDTTTNFISLASSNFTPLVAGEKYTVEYWGNAVGSQGSNLIPDSASSFTTGGTSYWTAYLSNVTRNDSGWLILSSTSAGGGIYKGAVTTSGRVYKISWKAKSAGYRGTMRFETAATSKYITGNLTDSWQTFSTTISATASTPSFLITDAYSGTVDIDSIYVKLITPPTITAKIGSKSWTSDTLSIIPGVFEPVVYNFQATSSEVNTPIKFYSSQADTIYVDNFSITQAYDLLLSAWITTPASNAGYGAIVSTRLDPNPYYAIIKNQYTTGAFRGGLSTNANFASQAIDLVATTDITDGVWHFVTVVYNRTGNMTIYNNGVSDGAASITGIGKIIVPQIQIGAQATAIKFLGQIGEVQLTRFTDISTMVQTPSTIYNRSKYANLLFPSSYTGGTIVGWWKMNNVNDSSASGNNMTNNGTVTFQTVDY